MKSKQIKRKKIGDVPIDTCLITLTDSSQYYETVIYNPKEKAWEIFGHDLTEKDALWRFDKACEKVQKELG